jgi:protoporphyrinogen oxidase
MLNNGKKLIIIGAGPAGLTAAYKASMAGMDSVVLEKDQVVGGISRTVQYKGYYFDIGGHRFFTKSKSVEQMWKEVLGDDLLECSRLSRLYFNNKFFFYPLRFLDAMMKLGIWNSSLIVCSYIYYQLFPLENEKSFENWIINRFGNRLYRTFFKDYTEKVLGMPCSEIRAEWAAQRIKGLSLIVALKDALIGNSSSKSDCKTLIYSFYYPKLGPGMMWQRVCDAVQQNGSSIMLGTEVDGILLDGNRVEALEIRRNGQTEIIRGTDFISSMPVKELVQKLKPVPDEVLQAANKLRYRDFILVALIVNRRSIFPDNWIYIHDTSLQVGRIQNFKNWSPLMVPDQEKTCLGMEYFCSVGDSLWEKSDEDLINLGREEIARLGLAEADEIEDGHVVRMPKAYPVYDSVFEKSIGVVRELIGGIENLQLVGRNGMHRYNNQDHSMVTAFLAVENIQGARHNLWEVNEELEYIEEITGAQTEAIRELLERSFSRMDELGFATAVGSVFGMFIFLATIFIALRGEGVAASYLQLLENYYFGYSVTVKGAFIGLAYGFTWAFLFGWLFAYLRNFFFVLYIYRVKRRAELLTAMDFFNHF